MFGNEVNKTNGEQFQKKKKKNYDGDTPQAYCGNPPKLSNIWALPESLTDFKDIFWRFAYCCDMLGLMAPFFHTWPRQ